MLDRDGRFHAVYGAAEAVFGRGAEELLSLNFLELCDAEVRSDWASRLQRVFAGHSISGSGRFAGGSARFLLTVFPIRPWRDQVSFAGGVAQEAPGPARVAETLESLETERIRLSRLLHDRVGQNLSAAGLQLDLLRMDLTESPDAARQRIGEVQSLLESIIELVREVNRELIPALAERIGLRGALDRLAGRLRGEFQGNVRVYAAASAQPPPETATALYRIAEEAAGCAVKLPGCSSVEILLKSMRNGVTLEVRNNAPVASGEQEPFVELEQMLIQHLAMRAGIELKVGNSGGGTVLQAIYRNASSEQD